jgi:hypothetical protein
MRILQIDRASSWRSNYTVGVCGRGIIKIHIFHWFGEGSEVHENLDDAASADSAYNYHLGWSAASCSLKSW